MAPLKPKRKNWGLQVALCAGVVLWQVYELATATEAPPTALLALQYLLVASGVIGGVGGLFMMARGGAAGG